MASNPRLSGSSLRVLRFLLEQPVGQFSGADLSKSLGISSGTLYPLLARFEGIGWVTSEWEAIDPRAVGRPRKRFYKLSGTGQMEASRALADLQVTTEVLQWT